MTKTSTPAPEVKASFLVRDKDGKPKFDRPLSEYPEWAREAFLAELTPTEREDLLKCL